jgi:rhodanese-related sulfurtransferase
MTSPNPAQSMGTLLPELANAPRLGNLAYAGEVSPEEAYHYLTAHEEALLIDVRTLPEWQFTGVPAIADDKLATICWKNYPDFSQNPKFTSQLGSVADKDTPLFFLCRSGGRSLDAAVAMTAEGYTYCFNVTGGFEGDPDASGHRGTASGWKAKQLPWKQG